MADILELLQSGTRIALAAVFIFMGTLHFVAGPARAMEQIIPPVLRRGGILSPLNLVRFTGACELAGGVGLLVPVTQFAAMVGLVLFLIAVFPANSYASEHPDRFGAIAIPFWPRYFAQLGLILVIVLSVL